MMNMKVVLGRLCLSLVLFFAVACSDDSSPGAGGNNPPQADATDDTTPGGDDTEPGPDTSGDADTTDSTGDGVDETCAGEQVRCEGVCIAVDGDRMNCGGCGQECGDEQACVDSQCVDTQRFCGGFVGATCEADEFCKFPDAAMCDFADQQGVCTARPTSCSTDVRAQVCGCNGVTYASECEAQLAGTDVASEGACGGGEQCDAMDARAEGDCEQVLGIVWDGDRCTYLSGCSCEGADCGKLYPGEDINGMISCAQDYDACIVDCRTEGCAQAGETCRACWWEFQCMPDNLAC